MKCKYCGVEIGNSLECHLCGHKQIGKTTCPVCSKLIYPYQEYCSNCGSPTIYRKSEPIKKVTPDTSVHSEASHNYHTVSESYDYKKNAYDYKKPFKDLNKYVPIQKNKKTFNHPNVRKNKRIVKIIIGIIVAFNLIIPIAGAIIGIIGDSLETGETTSFDDSGNSSLTDFNIQQDTSRSDYNYNFQNNSGGVYIYQNHLYLATGDQLLKYDSTLENKEVLEDGSCDHLYVDDRGYFYLQYGDLIFADHQNNKKTLLNDAYDCYVLDQSIFYIQNDNLYCLTIDDQMNKVANKKIKENVNHFSIDDQSQRILYENLNYKNQLIDFNGNVLKKDVDSYDDCYFSNGLLYYRTYQGIYYVDLDTQEEKELKEVDNIYRFALARDEANQQDIAYVESLDDQLDAYVGDEQYAIYDDARDYFVAGQYVVFYAYDDDYSQHYFIGNSEGMYTSIGE